MGHLCSKLKSSKPKSPVGSPANSDWEDYANDSEELKPNFINQLTTACPFYFGAEQKMHAPSAFRKKKFNPIIDKIADRVAPRDQNSQCLDIEDLTSLGKQHQICPYYLSKSRMAGSDIVILPYHYILNSDIRSSLQLNLENAIIVFDEAHNIDATCEEVLSFEIVIE